MARQNETVNVSSSKLLCMKKANTSKGKVGNVLHVVVKGIDIKALEALAFPGRLFSSLRMAY